ncbi:flavin-containing monooxygenase [Mycolicibacterium bacteremicum]|uniref:Cyclohexanone monooxygenase n=1 Tax=Mycolicibacterium bacteremicum TaxID=564198 RepID=A0A1W9Z0X5_MYCBA|nr:NAD(P)/FAD-dependent oxidoreductase [Mycolicibacterium bacteremicum]MCV7432479.1 NAD(P)/FAD-dependent oxidoreductase [Mycolicibacterium bacteremicum]ORA05944.1 cyclohexanone monooxygenase [Mycolicibacterium bacteremicum]
MSASSSTDRTLPGAVHTLVVGAGFAGLAAAAAVLRADPHADVLIIERADEVGGTWRDNTYPGCACDVPTSLYSFSFAPSAKWSHTFARQPEIYRYLVAVADQTGLRGRLITGCELLGAVWNADRQCWQVQTSLGELAATALVAATGALSTPKLPDVPGLNVFGGTVFHSATWDHEHDLTGERVAVIGTGASAVQFVPEIADRTAHLTVFQRTPAWVMPRLDRTLGRLEKSLYRRIPLTQKLVRGMVYGYREIYLAALAHLTWLLPLVQLVAKAQLRRQVPDPALRRALTPNFTIGCKRILLTNDWLPTLARDDVAVVTTALAEVTETGVRDGAGQHHDVDTIIFATGFTPTEPPVAHLLTGTDGATLAAHWAGSPSAHLGITVPGFPNLFLMYGPNTNLGHSSIVYMLESQAAYLAAALRVMRAGGVASVDVRADAEQQYNEWVADALTNTVWNSGGCSSWYLDSRGRNSVMWPTFTFRFRARTKSFDADNYTICGVPENA